MFKLVDYIDLGEKYTLYSIDLPSPTRFIFPNPTSNQIELRPSPTELLGIYSFAI